MNFNTNFTLGYICITFYCKIRGSPRKTTQVTLCGFCWRGKNEIFILKLVSSQNMTPNGEHFQKRMYTILQKLDAKPHKCTSVVQG